MSEEFIGLSRHARGGRRPRAGVPSTQRIEFTVTTAERAELARVARETRQPVATVIREAVNSYVADYTERSVFVVTLEKRQS